MTYSKNTKLKTIFENEKAMEIVQKHNLPCITCPMAAMEMDKLSLGQICRKYGIDEKKLIEELNRMN